MKRVNIPDQRTLGEGSSSCFNWDREKDYFESCCSLWHVNYLPMPLPIFTTRCKEPSEVISLAQVHFCFSALLRLSKMLFLLVLDLCL